MDPPPFSVISISPNTIQQTYPDSVESQSSTQSQPQPQPPLPRSRIGEPMNDEPLQAVPGAKLRLMCSYGGHIMPRPHDKSLSYIGGDTRIVVVDRHSSLKELCSRLSRTILNGRPFTLKYQLPNEDLDNLITVTTDEDLDNMVEEYDRLAMKPSSSRLRVFLFFTKPESTLSMGSLLDDAKSETWFVDALNNSGILSRGVSDSAAGDCFVNLDGVPASGSSNNLEAQGTVPESSTLHDNINNDNSNKFKNVSDVNVNSTPGSPMLENNSSTSSPSMANLPPIRVRVQQEKKVGLVEEQLAQMTFSSAVVMPVIPSAVTMASAGVVSEDERSDHGAIVGSRKPPLPLQLMQPRTNAGLSLPSPDSVTSDNSSIASTNSFSKIVYHQEQQVQPTHIDNKSKIVSDNVPTIQQIQESSYILPQQIDQNQQLQQPQQQFVHSNTHYIHHPTTSNQVPVSSYYQVYAPQSQQQYPVYVMPIGQTQQYNMTTLQHNLSDPNVIATAATPPIYPTKSVTPNNVASNSTTFVQIPSNQFQQQYVGLQQFHHQPPQAINVAPSGAATNYGYEYGGPVQEQGYYTQQQQQQTNVPLITQYQSMTPAAAAAALSDASKQFPADNIQQQNRTSQPV